MTLEVWPGGDRRRRERVGELRWANLTGGFDCRYRAVLFDADGNVVKDVEVPHVRSDGAWDLARQTLGRLQPLPAAPPEHAGPLPLVGVPYRR